LILSQDRPRVESFISTDDECFYEGNTGIVLWRQTDSRIEFKTWAESLCAVRLPPTAKIEYHPSVVVGAGPQHLDRIGRSQRCPALPNAYTPLLPASL